MGDWRVRLDFLSVLCYNKDILSRVFCGADDWTFKRHSERGNVDFGSFITQLHLLLGQVETRGDRSKSVWVTVTHHALLRLVVPKSYLPSYQAQGLPFGRSRVGDGPAGYLGWNERGPVIMVPVEWPKRHGDIMLVQTVRQFLNWYCYNATPAEEVKLCKELWLALSSLLPQDDEFAGSYDQRLEYLEERRQEAAQKATQTQAAVDQFVRTTERRRHTRQIADDMNAARAARALKRR